MSTLLALVIVLIVAIFLIGMVFYTLLGQHTRSQYTVDGLALGVAKRINVSDRVGHLNNALIRNRELVYLARERTYLCQKNNKFLAQLSERLVDEAYAGHDLVKRERENQIRCISDDVRNAVTEYNRLRESGSTFRFPWVQTFEPEVTGVDLGCVAGVQSNVRRLDNLEELDKLDEEAGYIENKSNLFKAEKNLLLPGPDDGLEYKLSSLPAYIEKSTAAPRNANPDVFKGYGSVLTNGDKVPYRVNKVPSAVQLFTEMGISMNPKKLDVQSVEVGAIGITNGAISNCDNSW